jgi:P27 family predicted phage terminase small subunit
VSKKKPPERRLRHDDGPQLSVVRVAATQIGSMAVPPAESGWLARTRCAWVTFWREALSTLTQPADGEALRRLFALYDARERTWRLFVKNPYTRGSKGQQVLNPMGTFALQLDARIERLEQAFGITPKARLQLGVVLGEAKKSLEDLAREASGGVEDASNANEA